MAALFKLNGAAGSVFPKAAVRLWKDNISDRDQAHAQGIRIGFSIEPALAAKQPCNHAEPSLYW